MDKIKFNDINFSSLTKLQQQGTKSTIYTDGDSCFKILDGLYDNEKELLYKKFIDMDGLKIDNVLLPNELIIQDGKLQGYTMDYFKDSIALSDKFMTRYVNCMELFSYITKASKILKTIHLNDVICQDLSFENILVDKSGNIAFCDLDGCSYKGYVSPFVSLLMNRFFSEYRNERIYLSKNLDRISMMLSLYYLVYGKELQLLSRKEYHYLSKRINTLQNSKKYANILVDKNDSIADIPYLDELIDISDSYVIDREERIKVRDFFRRKK